MKKRYFIVNASDCDGMSLSVHYITDGCYPNRKILMNYHRIASNIQHVMVITELTYQDLADYYGKPDIKDVVNYPPVHIFDDVAYGGNGD